MCFLVGNEKAARHKMFSLRVRAGVHEEEINTPSPPMFQEPSGRIQRYKQRVSLHVYKG